MYEDVRDDPSYVFFYDEAANAALDGGIHMAKLHHRESEKSAGL